MNLLLLLAISLALSACQSHPWGSDAGAAPPDDVDPGDPVGPGGPGPRPGRGTVDRSGGAVDRLYFGFTGDTRPASADDTAGYPVATIRGIFAGLAAADVQLALDLGDHMFVVSHPAEAAAQMGLYLSAAATLGPRPLLPTLGNHDCGAGNCYFAADDPNFVAFGAALAGLSALPYYRFAVDTRSGPAVFVVLADNYSGDQLAWAERTLRDADATARYTIVARHHPLGHQSHTALALQAIILRHRHTLLLTGHSHTYRRDPADASGRTVIYGLGGVPGSGPNFGYGLVQQGVDDRLYVTIVDQSTGLPLDAWSVAPQ